jgi:protein TonB
MSQKGSKLRAVARDPFAATLVLSVLIHAGLLVWFGRRTDAAPGLIAPERGRVSISLQATVAALPDPPEEPRHEAPLPPPPPQRHAPTPKRPELPRLSAIPISSLKDWVIAAVEPARRVATMIAESPIEEPKPETPSEPAPTPPPRPRPADTPAADRSSPGSVASEGADVDELPQIVSNPAPRYPAEALMTGIQGVVVLRVAIGADGRVVSTRVHRTSGMASLDEAALEAVRRWRFVPARRRGVPVAREVAVPVRFAIRGR